MNYKGTYVKAFYLQNFERDSIKTVTPIVESSVDIKVFFFGANLPNP